MDGRMSKRDEKAKGNQKGPQGHAEGQHGGNTHARFQEQLHSRPSGDTVEERVEKRHEQSAYEGKRRLVEDRQQHDDAERNSEKVRLTVERERGRDVGPSDNTESLRGTLGHREQRADYKARDRGGFEAED
jgi:hypothetical protein